MDELERAAECIDHLQAIISGLNEEPAGMNSPASRLEISKKVGPNGVPEEFVTTAHEAIQALLHALASVDRRIDDAIAGPPPEWWRNLRAILGDKRAEYALSHPALVDAFDILDGHVGEESVALGGLPFLVERLDQKIMRGGPGLRFRSVNDPNSNGISFTFDPEIDDQIDQSLRELLSEIPVLPKDCIAFLRRAFGAATEILEH